MGQQSRDNLTRLLSVLHGWNPGPRPNCLPKSKTLDLTAGRTRHMQWAGAALVVFWVSGQMPPDNRISFLGDFSDRRPGPQNMRWGDLPRSVLMLPHPLLLPANGSLYIDSQNIGTLTLHGMDVYPRRIDPTSEAEDKSGLIDGAHIEALVEALTSLEEILAP